MEVSRRRVLCLLSGLSAVVLTPVVPLLDRVLPRRYVEAIRMRTYPGRIRRLDEARVKTPGPWLG
jgi:hypothetical protein